MNYFNITMDPNKWILTYCNNNELLREFDLNNDDIPVNRYNLMQHEITNRVKSILPKCSIEKQYIDVYGANALFYAFKNTLHVSIDMYKSGAFSTNIITEDGSLVKYAIAFLSKNYSKETKNIVIEIIKKTSSIILNTPDSSGSTILMDSISMKLCEIASEIIKNKDFHNFCQIDNNGSTALENAIAEHEDYNYGNIIITMDMVIDELLRADKKIINYESKSKNTPFMSGLIYNIREETLAKIFDMTDEKDILKANNENKTALLLSLTSDHKYYYKIIAKNPLALSFLYDNLPLSYHIMIDKRLSFEDAVKCIMYNPNSIFYLDKYSNEKSIMFNGGGDGTRDLSEGGVRHIMTKIIASDVIFTHNQNKLLIESLCNRDLKYGNDTQMILYKFIMSRNINVSLLYSGGEFPDGFNVELLMKMCLENHNILPVKELCYEKKYYDFVVKNIKQLFSLSCENNLNDLAIWLIKNDLKSELLIIDTFNDYKKNTAYNYINDKNLIVYDELIKKYPKICSRINSYIYKILSNKAITDDTIIRMFSYFRHLNIKLDSKNEYGSTILMMACASKREKLCIYMIDSCKQLSIELTDTNKFGDDIFTLSILYELESVLLKLLEYKYFRGKKYIDTLTQNLSNMANLTNKLIELSIYDKSYIDDKKNNFLMVCCLCGNYENIKKYCDEFKLNYTNNNGDTLLLLACKLCSKKLIPFLLDKDADVNVVNKENVSVVKLCCKGELTEFLPRVITKCNLKNKLVILQELTSQKNIDMLQKIYSYCDKLKLIKKYQKWVAKNKYENVVVRTSFSKHPVFEYLHNLNITNSKKVLENECIICACPATHYYVFSPCQHAFLIDETCIGKIPKCPICRQNIEKYAKLFLV